MLPQGSQLLAEVTLIAAIGATAVADLSVRGETVTPDQLLVLWCVIGGMVGSFCSLQFFIVKTRVEAAWQLAVNLGLSAVVSPLLVDMVSYWTGYPLGLLLALPVSCGVGIGGQAAVIQIIPWGRKWLDGRARNIVKDD